MEIAAGWGRFGMVVGHGLRVGGGMGRTHNRSARWRRRLAVQALTVQPPGRGAGGAARFKAWMWGRFLLLLVRIDQTAGIDGVRAVSDRIGIAVSRGRRQAAFREFRR